MSTASSSRERYLIDSQGDRVAVVLDIDEYQAMLDQLDELEAIRAYDEAKASGDERVPLEQAIREIDEGDG